jgi:hypothetical protein
VAHLRFTPAEYHALSCLCRPLDLDYLRPPFVKRLLVASLAEALPALAGRIARLSRDELRLLLDHLREGHGAGPTHGLSPEEVTALAEAGVPLLPQARFAHLLKRALVRRLTGGRPALAAKVQRLGPRQFQSLCEQIRQQAGGGR